MIVDLNSPVAAAFAVVIAVMLAGVFIGQIRR